MTKEEAIAVLEELGGTQSNTPEYEACHIAILVLRDLDNIVEESVLRIQKILNKKYDEMVLKFINGGNINEIQ